MRSKLLVGLVLALVAVMFIVPCAMAQKKAAGAKLLCVSKKELKGEETVASCLAKGERFAVLDPYGLVRILTPEEVELTKAFNPKAFETRAYGMKYEKLAPAMTPFAVPLEASE
ncbi:MAG: succinylglutamate desuccinylase [Desulfobaccales bacterium]|nr:succinylglutamate desuccinylase [Desulfobaccales bacterium]